MWLHLHLYLAPLSQLVKGASFSICNTSPVHRWCCPPLGLTLSYLPMILCCLNNLNKQKEEELTVGRVGGRLMVAGRRQHVGCKNKRTEPIRALHSLRFSSRDGVAVGCGWGLTTAAVQRRRVLALDVLVKPRPAEEEACREQRGMHQSDAHGAPCGRRQRRSLTSQFHLSPEVNHGNGDTPTSSLRQPIRDTRGHVPSEHTHTLTRLGPHTCASLLHLQGELLKSPPTEPHSEEEFIIIVI